VANGKPNENNEPPTESISEGKRCQRRIGRSYGLIFCKNLRKTVGGLKVCKIEGMKAGIFKGMIRESYEHLDKLGNFFFFKNFGLSGAINGKRTHRFFGT